MTTENSAKSTKRTEKEKNVKKRSREKSSTSDDEHENIKKKYKKTNNVSNDSESESKYKDKKNRQDKINKKDKSDKHDTNEKIKTKKNTSGNLNLDESDTDSDSDDTDSDDTDIDNDSDDEKEIVQKSKKSKHKKNSSITNNHGSNSDNDEPTTSETYKSKKLDSSKTTIEKKTSDVKDVIPDYISQYETPETKDIDPEMRIRFNESIHEKRDTHPLLPKGSLIIQTTSAIGTSQGQVCTIVGLITYCMKKNNEGKHNLSQTFPLSEVENIPKDKRDKSGDDIIGYKKRIPKDCALYKYYNIQYNVKPLGYYDPTSSTGILPIPEIMIKQAKPKGLSFENVYPFDKANIPSNIDANKWDCVILRRIIDHTDLMIIKKWLEALKIEKDNSLVKYANMKPNERVIFQKKEKSAKKAEKEHKLKQRQFKKQKQSKYNDLDKKVIDMTDADDSENKTLTKNERIGSDSKNTSESKESTIFSSSSLHSSNYSNSSSFKLSNLPKVVEFWIRKIECEKKIAKFDEDNCCEITISKIKDTKIFDAIKNYYHTIHVDTSISTENDIGSDKMSLIFIKN